MFVSDMPSLRKQNEPQTQVSPAKTPAVWLELTLPLCIVYLGGEVKDAIFPDAAF